MKSSIIKSLVSMFFFMLFNTQRTYSQCAMCRAVLENGDKQEVAQGINNGILYLMIIPYVLIAIVGYAIYKSRKKKA
ncbi:hypothetical protein NBT05_01675 [Aquimarina sp. ERC-38]|nr:hypothetical protein NBT05_01675 [Aquimarina sp. ERC-38]